MQAGPINISLPLQKMGLDCEILPLLVLPLVSSVLLRNSRRYIAQRRAGQVSCRRGPGEEALIRICRLAEEVAGALRA